MNQQEKLKAILFIRPNAEFVLRDSEIEWHDAAQTQPTEEEIAQGWIDYQAKEAADKAEAEAKRQALLDKLGITEDEARLLLGGN
jgi:hypothetical protein